MPRIAAGSTTAEVDLVAFDKDGTLIDFHHLWSRKARLAVEAVARAVDGGEDLERDLYRSIGYDPKTGTALADGPLSISTMPKLHTICATVLYQHGHDWHDAEAVARHAFSAGLGAIPTADLVKPLGRVVPLFRQLTEAGAHVAIVTSDDRDATEATMALLGLDGYVSALVCGNDALPSKPAPDCLLHLGERFRILPKRMAMVGDTVGDLTTATAAGAGCRIGVLSGTGRHADLAPHADALIASIDEIKVLG
uniref:Putative haloacid dehalogenase-like hydrolase family protein n=1 Tax=uncultured bacterium 1114 TaxID=548901 RepID=B8R951_9BACT|nr:putative haloacid dehalogenase-like hydrolase family protein [uncultured bacterium 1114]